MLAGASPRFTAHHHDPSGEHRCRDTAARRRQGRARLPAIGRRIIGYSPPDCAHSRHRYGRRWRTAVRPSVVHTKEVNKDDEGDDLERSWTRGFTGHEHINDFSLIHMNGRVFNPVLSREPRACLGEQPAGRFEFTFTPKHGSWLDLVEGFFSKLARSVLRHIRIASKRELKDRLMAAVDYFNDDPVVHTWTYKLDKSA